MVLFSNQRQMVQCCTPADLELNAALKLKDQQHATLEHEHQSITAGESWALLTCTPTLNFPRSLCVALDELKANTLTLKEKLKLSLTR